MILVKKIARHRIALARDIPLAEHDLKQVRSFLERAEHLGATDEIGAPNAPESLIEFSRIQRVWLEGIRVSSAIGGLAQIGSTF